MIVWTELEFNLPVIVGGASANKPVNELVTLIIIIINNNNNNIK